jgi:NAD(P)H dehydrogenase (quinone)
MSSQQHSDPTPLPRERDKSTARHWMSHPEDGSARQHQPARILILYWSMSGHIDVLARAVAGGAIAVEGIEVTLKRVPEIMSEEKALEVDNRLEQAITQARIDELPDYDSIIFSTPTLSGKMCKQMCNFLDQASKLWMEGSLFSKVGSVLTATRHGGLETNIASFRTTLLHHGMIFVDVPSTCDELLNMEAISGGRPRGASIPSDGGRRLSANELAIARFQGRYLAQMTKWLVRGTA